MIHDGCLSLCSAETVGGSCKRNGFYLKKDRLFVVKGKTLAPNKVDFSSKKDGLWGPKRVLLRAGPLLVVWGGGVAKASSKHQKNPKTHLLAPWPLSNSFFLEEGEEQKGMSLETLSFQIAKIRCQEK